ncbi:MAG: S-layer homology domain-containing protein [Bacillaceae bacterium]|nr:S-layer homology domain-containing protein [Bacillaceae bacterium]
MEMKRIVYVYFVFILFYTLTFSVSENASVSAYSSEGQRTSLQQLATGKYHTLALKSDGSVVAWGSENINHDFGQSTVPSEASSGVSAIAAGGEHSLALKTDGSVIAWGNDGDGQSTVPVEATSGIVAIAAGHAHSLALKSDGSVVAWGSDNYGQSTVPAGGSSDVIAIAAGDDHSLALKSDGSVVAWGRNSLGQTTVPAGASTEVVAIAAGGFHSLALKSDGSVVAWGSDNYGQSTVPAGGSSDVIAIAAGDDHSLALKSDGSVVAWGSDSYGQSTVPTDASTSVSAIVADGYHSLVLKADGNIVSWGNNDDGQINVPSGLTVPVKAEAIATGYGHALVLKTDGTIDGWGRNVYGQTNVPSGLENVVAIDAGREHSLALKSDGNVVAWGNSDFGQTNVPSGLNDAIAIVAGVHHSLALRSDGSVVAWGNNEYNQINVPIDAQSGVKSIAAGFTHSLALKSDGSVIAWGSDIHGESMVPTAAQSGVISIAAGYSYSMALKSDGTLVAWGRNDFGQTDVPAGLDDAVAIAAGEYHSMALKSDGTVVAWGRNNRGQTDVPAGLDDVVAIAAGESTSMALKSDGTVVVWGLNIGQADIPGNKLLNDLTIDEGEVSPAFDPNVTDYSLYVDGSTGSVHLTALLSDSDYTGLIVNDQELSSGHPFVVPLTGSSTVIPIQVEPYFFSGQTYTVTVNKDLTPPSVNFGTNGSETYAQSAHTMVTVDDTESGLDSNSLQYVWTQSASTPGAGVSWTSFASGDTLSINGVDGDWYLHVKAQDEVGNTVNIATNRFRLDNSSPVVTIEFQKDDGSLYTSGDWTNQNVTANVYAEDDYSGIQTIEISTDDGLSWNPYGVPLSFASEGTYTLQARAVDNVGLTSSVVSKTVNINRSGLILEVPLTFADDGTAYTSGEWTKRSVTASVYAYHTTPGVSVTSISYSLDGGTTWSEYHTPLSFTAEGTHTLDVKANDSAGNEIRLTPAQKIRIDRTAPIVVIDNNGSESFAHSASTIVTVSDNESGVNSGSLKYVWTQSASTPGAGVSWTSFASGDTLSMSGVNGDWYLHIKAQDAVGNTVDKATNRFRLRADTSSSASQSKSSPAYRIIADEGGSTRLVVSPTIIHKVAHLDSFEEKVKITERMLMDALTELNRNENLLLTIAIDDTQRKIQVEFPADALMRIHNSIPNLKLEVELNDSRYQLSINSLELERRAAQLGEELKDLKLHVIMQRADEAEERVIGQLAIAKGLQLAGPVIDFKVRVEAESQTLELDNFGRAYMERAILLLGDSDDKQLIGVLYDPDTQTFSYIPSQLGTRSDGTKEVVMYVPHNSMYTVLETSNVSFEDLQGHWAQDDIELMASRLIIQGVGGNQFSPDQTITRAEFTALLVRSLGLSLNRSIETSAFDDVNSEAWYAPAIEAAVQAGLVKGVSADHFAPNAPITREQMMVLIANAMTFTGVHKEETPALTDEAVLAAFKDRNSISSWAENATIEVVQAGIVQGLKEDKLAPGMYATRAQAVVILKRYLVYVDFLQE